MPSEEQRLRAREDRIVAEIERRKTNSQRQADMALGRNQSDDDDQDEQRRRTPLTTNERQARAALGRDS